MFNKIYMLIISNENDWSVEAVKSNSCTLFKMFPEYKLKIAKLKIGQVLSLSNNGDYGVIYTNIIRVL